MRRRPEFRKPSKIFTRKSFKPTKLEPGGEKNIGPSTFSLELKEKRKKIEVLGFAAFSNIMKSSEDFAHILIFFCKRNFKSYTIVLGLHEVSNAVKIIDMKFEPGSFKNVTNFFNTWNRHENIHVSILKKYLGDDIRVIDSNYDPDKIPKYDEIEKFLE